MLFNIIRYLILSERFSYFSLEWNNTGYLVPSFFLTYPSILSKITHEGFAPTQFCMQHKFLFLA